jgi:hypothetical protein
MPIHSTLAGPETHEPFHWIGPDPPPNPRAKDYWLETDADPHRLWRRNDANTAWVGVGPTGTDPEVVRDTMAAALRAGSNISITPDDANDIITIALSAVAGSGVETILVPHSVDAGAVASHTSTTTFFEHLGTSRVLPAPSGTWDILTLFFGGYTNGTANSGAEARVSVPVAGAARGDATPGGLYRFPVFAFSRGDVASDGVAATAFRADYRARTGGTAYALNGLLLGICQRKSV